MGGSGAASKGSYGGMATLKGSEKQVAWAKDIRAIANEAINDSIAYVKTPEMIAQMGKDAAKQAVSRAKNTQKVINSTSNASDLIDTLGSYIGYRTGDEGKAAALIGIARTSQNATGDFAKKLKKAWMAK